MEVMNGHTQGHGINGVFNTTTFMVEQLSGWRDVESNLPSSLLSFSVVPPPLPLSPLIVQPYDLLMRHIV